jgi:hypothetical protein
MILIVPSHALCSYINNLWATGKDNMACAWIRYKYTGTNKSFIKGRYGYTAL